MVNKAKEEKIAKLKHDLSVPKIKFREIKEGQNEEDDQNSDNLDESEVAQPEAELSGPKKATVGEAKPPGDDEFDYSRAESSQISSADSRPSIEYKDEAKELNESDYLKELINAKDDDLDTIEDPKKRQEIIEYRKNKRAQAEEELRLDGNPYLLRT